MTVLLSPKKRTLHRTTVEEFLTFDDDVEPHECAGHKLTGEKPLEISAWNRSLKIELQSIKKMFRYYHQ